MIEEWRATCDPALEPLIARLGRGGEPITAASKTQLEAAWHAVAATATAADVQRLLDVELPGNWKLVLARVEALAPLCPDPRIALALLQVAGRFSSEATLLLHRRIARLLVESACAAMEPGLAVASAMARRIRILYEPVERAAARLEPREADPLLLEEVRAVLPPQVDTADLFLELARDPGSIAVRTVLADALQESGDPRGELIALQLLPTRDGRANQRIAELLGAHADAWTGPLPGVDRTTRRFERGFLAHIDIMAPPDAIKAAVKRSEWITVESLGLATTRFKVDRLIRRMPLLRDLMTIDEILDQLEELGPLPALRRLGSAQRWVPSVPGAFPGLELIAGDWQQFRWDVAAYREQVAAAVELGIRGIAFLGFDLAGLGAALRDRGRGPERLYVVPARATSFDPPGFRIRVLRDEPVAELAYNGTAGWDDLAELRHILSGLANGGVKRLVMHSRVMAGLRQEIASSRLVVSWVDDPLPIE